MPGTRLPLVETVSPAFDAAIPRHFSTQLETAAGTRKMLKSLPVSQRFISICPSLHDKTAGGGKPLKVRLRINTRLERNGRSMNVPNWLQQQRQTHPRYG
jgi:hypothetical protein